MWYIVSVNSAFQYEVFKYYADKHNPFSLSYSYQLKLLIVKLLFSKI